MGLKKNILYFSILAITTLSATQTLANPPCPESANRLEGFAHCMTRLPNKMGYVLGGRVYYSSPQMDHHNAALMASLGRSDYVSPQVNPIVPAVSLASNMAVAMTYYSRHGQVPYGWWWITVPIYP